MCDKIGPLSNQAGCAKNVGAGAHGRSSDQQQHCRETYIFAVHEIVSLAEGMSGRFGASDFSDF